MEVDYLIIGSGLAGISFAESCLLHHKKIMVLNDNSQNSTTIAGGLYNPIVLKRFTKIWEAEAGDFKVFVGGDSMTKNEASFNFSN